ncbi:MULTISPECIES: hypothetical protein [unclassified Leisingera]|uniref:hypothetical protein n=1 Tax=unclassified Leisingera TaxID=2614906 RepID=UPI0003690813|nr:MULTISPECIES: hypothetical protein [unclassified Leisingera]KIC16792.1 hypothetical protein RA21_11345 [Leisingera sp. ANG-DT]KIC25690.1 hypothetical protein RA23_07545 [Leisingera sp. ANG-S3]KIC29321.1 hypothetical protein RA24_06850 [Leisingera sp. ANG-M6]KIC54206.1 hypothetical protein RA22_06000 [Leisingera sp. ANG-S]KID10973.1 hypothetical protein GC1_04755 [Leisingera sp. ANG1]
MYKLLSHEPDFKAEISILTAEQGGSSVPAFNKLRWDFRYGEDSPTDEIYMIHPIFLDEDGVPFPDTEPLSGIKDALMTIVVREMVSYHRQRISVGTNFYCVAGRKVYATGVVTELLGIQD